MKKLILVVTLIVILCNVCVANDENVILYNDEKEVRNNNENDEIPVVNYKDNEVTITSMCIVENALVVIRDEGGTVVAQEQVILSPTGSIISVPENYADYCLTIQILYENTNLYGYLPN